jgi:hypothetical protein
MGMFDYLHVDYPLPIDAPDWVTQATIFQCKQTPEQGLDNYTISKEGKLIFHSVQWETVPENERPYWGKPEWDTTFGSFVGSIRSIPTGDVEISYHGYLCLSAMSNTQPYQFYEMVASFTHGHLDWLKTGCDCMLDP